MLTQQTSIESILKSDQVPTLPEVAVEVLRVASQQEPSLDELTQVIRMDPAIAGRIVKFANSPLFGVRRTAATIESAVVLLGTTMIRTLVLGFTLAEKGPAEDLLRRHFQQIWRETLFQASAAELLGERHSGVDPAVWFLAGLLQDAGRLVMLNVFQDEYVSAVIHGDTDVPLSDREAQAFGFSHAEVSAALCRSWNLGDEIFLAITTHHSAHADRSCTTATIEDAMRAASICNQYMEAVSGEPESTRLAVERELIHVHGCRPDEVIEHLAEMDGRARGLAAVLNADVGTMPPREVLLENAQSALFEIAMAEQLRRLNKSEQPPEKVPSHDTCSWLDSETGTFDAGLLDQILPDEISDTAVRNQTLGMLSITATLPDQVSKADGLRAVADAVRSCVRPTDQIVRHGSSGFIALLPELSMNMLAKVARRIIEHASEGPADQRVSIEIGGLMVIPEGRKIATIKSVLSGLESSLKRAHQTGSEQFHILQGRKLHLVQPAE